MRSVIALSAIIIVGGLSYAFWPTADQNVPGDAIADGALADVLLPDTLSQNAQIGKLAYETKCSACHGTNAAGQDGKAPPLVHIIYRPSHHGDEAFQRAAAIGVRAHHWSFGDMPAVDGITRGDVTMIVAYIRELQLANGIN
jgi:cytochrome c